MSARDYAKVLPTFWTGATGRAIRRLGPECQVVALYLITSPHALSTGLYHLPIAYLCADTGCPIEGASKALRRLSEEGFCRYDEATETVWVPEMARHQIGETLSGGDKRRQWVTKEVEKFRKRPFFNDFLEKYGNAYGVSFVVDAKPHRSPIEAPSEPHRSLELELETKTEQELERAHEVDHAHVVRVYSQLRSEAHQAKTGNPGGTYRRTTRDWQPVEDLVAWAREQSDPAATLEDSLRGYLADEWATGAGWPISTWAKDPGRYNGRFQPRGGAYKAAEALERAEVATREARLAYEACSVPEDRARLRAAWDAAKATLRAARDQVEQTRGAA